MNSFTKSLVLSGLGLGLALLTSMVQMHAVVNSNATFTSPYSNSDRITNVSVKQGPYDIKIMGLIENIDPNVTVEGVNLAIQLYDKNNRLIGVTSGFPQQTTTRPGDKTAFEIGDADLSPNFNQSLDYVFIQTLGSNSYNSTDTDKNITNANASAQNAIQPGTLQQCYENNIAWMLLGSLLSAEQVNLFKPAVKSYFIETCEFYKSQLGFYPKISSLDDNEKVRSNISDQNLTSFIETHPLPEALQQLNQSLTR